MKKRSQFKIVCFLITIILIISCCFVGCGAGNNSSSQVETTITATTIVPTTQQNTTVTPTTVKPTEVTKPTEPIEESNVNEPEDKEYNDFSNNDNEVPDSMSSGAIYSPSEFMSAGAGRWTDSDGYVCDENGYVCLASTSVDRYSIIETPFGRTGKVYDSGCAYGVMDVYVNW